MKGFSGATQYLCALWLLALAAPLQAHVASNGFIDATVSGATVSGTLELNVRDAEMAVGLDADRDGRVTWGEVRRASGAVTRYLAAHLQLSAQGIPCALHFGDVRVNARIDGNYLWEPFTAECSAAVQRLRIDYRILDEEDPSHRGLLALRAGGVTQTAVLGAAGTSGTVSTTCCSWSHCCCRRCSCAATAAGQRFRPPDPPGSAS
jgi:hypothetical protein